MRPIRDMIRYSKIYKIIRTIIHPMISGCQNFEFHTIIIAKFHTWPDGFYEVNTFLMYAYTSINNNIRNTEEAV